MEAEEEVVVDEAASWKVSKPPSFLLTPLPLPPRLLAEAVAVEAKRREVNRAARIVIWLLLRATIPTVV